MGREMPAPDDETDESIMPGLVPGPGVGPMGQGQPGVRPWMNPGMGPQTYPGPGGPSVTPSNPTPQATPAPAGPGVPPSGSTRVPGVVVPQTPSTPNQQPTRPPTFSPPEDS